MKWEGEDKEGVTRESEREKGKKEREGEEGGIIVTDNSALKQ